VVVSRAVTVPFLDFEKVVIGEEESETIPVSYIRCTPGLCPWPFIIFLIYSDDTTRIPLSKGTKLVLYGSDTLFYRDIDYSEDYIALQMDINSVSDCMNQANYLTFNASKCKYKLTSHRRQHHCDPPELLLDSSLDVLNTGNLEIQTCHEQTTWHLFVPKLISFFTMHRFYKNAEPSALFQLNLSLVRPHLEYKSDVLDPHPQKDITLIEVGLKICAKQLDLGYDVCILYKLIIWNTTFNYTMFKNFIVHNLISILVPCRSRTGYNAYL